MRTSAALLAVLALACCTAAPASERVIAGSLAPAGSWPSIAALVAASRPNADAGIFCGGTLVHPRWVLTAAHCVTQAPNLVAPPQNIHVVTGRKALADSAVGQRIGVQEIVVHPNFTIGQLALGSDLAMLLLESPAAAPPMPYATGAGYVTRVGVPNVAGWGAASPLAPSVTSNLLLEGYSQLIDVATCGVPQAIRPATVCTATTSGVNTCHGDSGGPLVVFEPTTLDPVLWGVVSGGGDPCASAVPTKYSWVPFYRSFVDGTIATRTPGPPAPVVVTTPASTTTTSIAAPPPAVAPAPKPAAAVAPDRTPPVISRLGLSPSSFRAARTGAMIAAARGTRVRFALSEAATVTLTVTRRTCRGRRCTFRPVRDGEVALEARAGQTSFRLTGRLLRGRMSRGRHHLELVAEDAAGNRSATRTLAYRVR